MTSTVVDVGLCLVLVTAAASMLVVVPGDEPAGGGRADAVAQTVATTTADVNYSLAPGAAQADDTLVSFPRRRGPEFERSTHGTLAGLLAKAAVDGMTVDGERVTHTSDGFRRAVRETVARRLGERTQVVAVWRPYRHSNVEGRMTVGATPPPDATVHAATLSMPSGYPAGRARARAVAAPDEGDDTDADGFDDVARVVADRLVSGTFPPRKARFALAGDYPVSRLVRYRYRRMGALYDASVVNGADADESIRPREANEKLEPAVADAVERDFRREFDTSEQAAEAVEIGRVRIVVRTWSA